MSKLQVFRSVIVFTLLCLALIAFFKIWPIYRFSTLPAETEKKESTFLLVEPGANPWSIARELESTGVTSDSVQFHRLGRIMGYWKNLKVGDYELSPNMAPIKIFETLGSGKSTDRAVTFQEGINLFQIADKLSNLGYVKRETFISAARDPSFLKSLGFAPPIPPSLEGYLFPETYRLNRTMRERDILKLLYQNFSVVWNDRLAARASDLGMTRNEVITLASIIEKETGAASERKIISSVFHNRLKKKMRLQTDPTIIYGIWESYNGNIKLSHKKIKNQYNTYVIKGLPIGAIANPGKKSIEAALFPEKTNFLYFVSRNDGTHKFTSTYKEHIEAVNKYQLDPKARRGKSWRDLEKSKTR